MHSSETVFSSRIFFRTTALSMVSASQTLMMLYWCLFRDVDGPSRSVVCGASEVLTTPYLEAERSRRVWGIRPCLCI